jgi:hypothetical protein
LATCQGEGEDARFFGVPARPDTFKVEHGPPSRARRHTSLAVLTVDAYPPDAFYFLECGAFHGIDGFTPTYFSSPATMVTIHFVGLSGRIPLGLARRSRWRDGLSGTSMEGIEEGGSG